MSQADLKTTRTMKKSALTRLESKVLRLVAEQNKEEVKKNVDDLKKGFISFEEAHEEYSATLTTDVEIEQSDVYFVEVEEKYTKVLTEVNEWFTSVSDVQIKVESTVNTKEHDDQSALNVELLNAIHLPKLELCSYDGNPLRYYEFMTAFDETVDSVATTGSAKLSRLVSYTTGEARKAIQSCLVLGGEAGYKLARRTLKERCGDDLTISQAIISSLRDGPPVKSAADTRSLADQLVDCNVVLTRLGNTHEIESQRFITAVVNRLQQFVKGRWKKVALDKKQKEGKYPDFEQLVKFVKREADNASDPVYGDAGLLRFNRSKPNFSPSPQFQSRSGSQPKPQQKTSFISEGRTDTCPFCQQLHRLYACNGFKALKVDQRLDFISKNKICENCLLGNHTVDTCYRQSMCGIDGCSQKHSRFIHSVKMSEIPHSSSDTTTADNVSTVPKSNTSAAQVTVFTQSNSQICIPIVDVRVNNVYDCAAILDTASNTTYCTKSLATKLGVTGIPITFELSTLTNQRMQCNTNMIPSLFIESKSVGHSFTLRNVYITDVIPACKAQIDVNAYDHLQGINATVSCDKIDILVGQDNAEAMVPLEVRRGKCGEPYAVRTILGWTIHGNTDCQSDICGLIKSGKVSHRVMSNFIQSDSVVLDRLEEKVDKLWRIDHEDLACTDKAPSFEDDQVIKLWNENVNFVNGHYQMPIPWKQGVTVPDNKKLAQSRLRSLKCSLEKRGLLVRYNQEIQKLIDKCYAEPVMEEVPESQTLSSKIWYLPHHDVISDKKPGKLRVVFDCAARYEGESLNDKCKQGPDLNNKLLHVILRFRQYMIAIMGDIEAMYYQVKVCEEDRDALRFLWVNSEGEEVVYRMNVHIFGGVWCACIATYAMRRTLQDQKIEDDVVCDIINRSFYVDDCLTSFSSVDEAKKVVEDVKQVLNTGGFNLTKFVTNDEGVLLEIDEEDRAKEIKDVKEFDRDVVSKALGVIWDVKEDVFKIRVDVKKKDVTRKSMLSTIASMYDPLGLVSPCVITGKMLFQEATRLKLSWDEEVPSSLAEDWKQWLLSLDELRSVSFPRCMTLIAKVIRYEIHNFSDASQKGYGCCNYLRCISEDGKVHTSLIMSKGRVAPMKHVTIPRLELQAALLSAQMNEVVCRELDLPIAKSYFWIDSQIVLAYIKNKKKRLKVYVDNRVSMIRTLTDENQWKFVPGKINPADCISRGLSPEKLKNCRWKEGPDFLLEFNDDQIKEETYEIAPDDVEIKKEVVVNVVKVDEITEHPIDSIINYFSSWIKVKKSVAWLLKIKSRLIEKSKKKEVLTLKDLVEAEKLLLKHVQAEKYDEEIKSLTSGQEIKKSSSIKSLLPILNEDGILCVGGRLKFMKKQDEYAQAGVNPYILPHDHVITILIVRQYHEIAHQGTEWTLSFLRRKFWITRSRGIIRKIRQKCVICKKLFDQPVNQQMANLPPERLQVVKPFTHVGIDCFGPFYVKQSRSEVKRYGCIYTCLNIRAVHIEKLDSLNTDSFINGFRRFMSRRGTPMKVWSDNGTNLVGASPEILKCLEKLDEEKIRRFGLEKEVEWNFNTPHASHKGGVWERQIRTIRKILSSLICKHQDKMSDEVLNTFFCEVEAIINSRPLTKLSEDVTDMSTLSPVQLLLLNEETTDFPGHFHKNDMYRSRWKFIQYLANQFWKRWLKEYLPELQRRSKWCKEQENFKVGDVVLLCEENTPRFLWPLGLVVDVKVGRDNLIRTVKVKTKSTELIRPVSKVVKLEG